MKKYITILLFLIILFAGCTDTVTDSKTYDRYITVKTMFQMSYGNCNCMVLGTDDVLYSVSGKAECDKLKIGKQYEMEIITNKECDIINVVAMNETKLVYVR